MSKIFYSMAYITILLVVISCGGNPKQTDDKAELIKSGYTEPASKGEMEDIVEAELEVIAPEKDIEPTEITISTQSEMETEQAADAESDTRISTTIKLEASSSEVEQKISYSKLMFMSKSAKRITASDNSDAKAIINQAREKVGQASSVLSKGDIDGASKLVDESLRLFNSAALMVPSESLIQEKRKYYNTLLNELKNAKESHKKTLAAVVVKQGSSAAIKYDDALVMSLVKNASDNANLKNYDAANASLQKAQDIINGTVSKMFGSQTIVYEINLDTPEGEFKYEYERYLGYEELIPVAIEEKKPTDGLMKLIDRSVEKGMSMRDKALEMADKGKYPVAIRMIIDATKEIRRALRIMGVKQ